MQIIIDKSKVKVNTTGSRKEEMRMNEIQVEEVQSFGCCLFQGRWLPGERTSWDHGSDGQAQQNL